MAAFSCPGRRVRLPGRLGGFNLSWDATWTVATLGRLGGVVRRIPHSFTTLRYGAARRKNRA